MRMLKKAAAVLMAAAMSLTLLTACGGGSGSGSLTAQALGSKYTIKYTLVESNGKEVSSSEGYSAIVMTDGTRFYDEEGIDATLTNADGSYTVNPKNKKAFKKEKKDDMAETLTAATAVTSGSPKEYKGKTYITETATFTTTDGKISVTYCFYDGKPEYMMQDYEASNGRTYSQVYHIDSLSKSVDESVLDIKNYEIVDDYDALDLKF